MYIKLLTFLYNYESVFFMMFITTIIQILASLLGTINGANILGVFPVTSYSHWTVYESVMIALADRGHNVTVITSFPQKSLVKNLVEIDVSESFPSSSNKLSIDKATNVVSNAFTNQKLVAALSLRLCKKGIQLPQVQYLLKSNIQFDVVFTEIFGADCDVGFAYHFKAPLVSIISSTYLPWCYDRVGNPDNPSYISTVLTKATNNMNFFQRVTNTLNYIIHLKILWKILSDWPTEHFLKETYGSNTPHINDIVYNTSMVFVNSHFTLDGSRPLVPNMVEIGGIHVKTPRLLPQNILKFIEESPNGVLFFTLGSMVRSSSIPTNVLQIFMDVFASLPIRVLWKYESDMLEKPDNVFLSKWMPQRDILDHPKVQIFMTHGGNLGIIEAVHVGKPVIGIPFFLDQPRNIIKLVEQGAGIMLDYKSLTKETLYHAINSMIQNSSYNINAKILSKRFHDRPMSASKTAVYWTEYIIKNKGALELRNAAIKIPWWKLHSIDMVLFVAVILLCTLYIIFILFKIILKFLLYLTVPKTISILTFCLVYYSICINGANILGVFPLNGYSHWTVSESIMKALAARGHNVTVISPFPQKSSVFNYTDIDISDAFFSMVNKMNTDMVLTGKLSNLHSLQQYISNHQLNLCRKGIKLPQVQALLNSGIKFDAVFTAIFASDCDVAYAYHFKAPLLSVMSTAHLPYTYDRVGGPDNPSYVPTTTTKAVGKMNFKQRLINTLYNIYFKYTWKINSEWPADMFLKETFGPNTPYINDIVYNTSLVFVNGQFSLDGPRPLANNMVEIGGIQIQNRKPIPKDILKFIEDSPNGVMIFSMGSFMRVSSLPKHILQIYKDVFSKLSVRVLWKYEEEMPDKPDNVFISSWLPQRDILSHPKVRLFMTHGGNLGILEAVYSGVPVIGIPYFFDQPRNILKVVEQCAGILLEYESLTRKTLSDAINKILINKNYSVNAKKLSEKFKDRPLNATEAVIYWTDYVIRHKGAPNLRNTAVNISLWQYFLVVDIGFFIIAIFLILLIMYFMAKFSYEILKKKKFLN
ncbi:uncharacterized protein LOC126895255 [Daktulosphaira vitifoliae]|uniref:uncharacterized protein LOC126895255 n=1 Tax=Daktulosphaira vitifoliae TaxID=58002 RepID=UPI0021AA5185|nr:uncharacterized protein LOC126895255 [Daktulosphaira vitifoliae]